MALKWPHLERVGDKLMPITDAEVGLLIGYNCPRALAPREIIVPEGDGPYAQQTDLGWGIVGVVDYGVDSEDNIGFSGLMMFPTLIGRFKFQLGLILRSVCCRLGRYLVFLRETSRMMTIPIHVGFHRKTRSLWI